MRSLLFTIMAFVMIGFAAITIGCTESSQTDTPVTDTAIKEVVLHSDGNSTMTSDDEYGSRPRPLQKLKRLFKRKK